MSRNPDSMASTCFATVAACVLLGLPGMVLASACLYRGTDATARVMSRSSEITTPFPEALASQDCGRLRVASGSVSVYVLSADRSAISRREVSVGSGSLVPATSAAPADSGGTAQRGLLQQIMVVLEGGQRSRTGSSRSAEGDYVIAALPIGRLAQPTADLIVNLGPVPDANLGQFDVRVDGKQVHRQVGPQLALRLPFSSLKAGARVQWTLAYSGRRHEGEFSVEPAAALAALQQSLVTGSALDVDTDVAKLRLASGLMEAGFAWDARELIRAALSP
jgi:hypothetical protein